MGFGTELLDSVTGNVEHAVITIEDKRAIDALNSAASNSSVQGLSQYVQAVRSQSVINEALEKGVTKRFRVQFNPSTLSLNAQGGGERQKLTAATNADGKKVMAYSCVVESPKISMNVTLVFDAVNNSDSFMNEKFILNPASLGAQVINSISGKEFTVQPYVEGFMAAVRNPSTRELSFNWGDFVFKGKLDHVNSKYTMFSVSGQPVRAEVSLSMITKQNEIVREDYQKLSTTETTSMGRSLQQVGNLLNLPF